MTPDPAPLQGKDYWRSLGELADTPEFRAHVEREFPFLAEDADRGFDRRRFLQLMAASIGLTGLAGCRRPQMEILPYATKPEEVVPGLPTYYATTIPRPGTALPVLVESHEGRPTKIEGNPQHPASGGATDARGQAAVLDLYDPDRSKRVKKKGEDSDWAAFTQFADAHFAGLRKNKGKGLRFLGEDVSSPAVNLLREHLKQTMPEAAWHVYEPLGRDNVREGARLAFKESVLPTYRFDEAAVVVALDCDFLGLEEDAVAHTRGFAKKRRDEHHPNRLYAVENHFTVTGAKADHRLRVPASQVRDVALALAKALEVEGLPPPSAAPSWGKLSADEWAKAIADDLLKHKDKGTIVLAGRRQPAAVHAVVHLINEKLGNHGKTVRLLPAPEPAKSLAALVEEIKDNQVDTLVILGGDPVYDAPSDFDLGPKLHGFVKHTVRLGLYEDETSRHCGWHIPATHFLEAWGDAETTDGVYSPVQPLIAPLYKECKSDLELVAYLLDFKAKSGYDVVKEAFKKRAGEAGTDAAFRKFLHLGVHGGPRAPVQPKPDAKAVADAAKSAPPTVGRDNLELSFHPDSHAYDGRFANNAWMQELPDPVTKLTWDNAAILSPTTARELGVTTGDVLALDLDGRKATAAAFVLPGQADHSVSLSLGYGRKLKHGRVGNDLGFNAYDLRTSKAPDFAAGLKAVKSRTERRYELVSTEDHGALSDVKGLQQQLKNRDLLGDSLKHGGHSNGKEHAGHADGKKELPMVEGHGGHEEHPDLVKPSPVDPRHKWGMVIDMNVCTGCSACVVACQSENNIPVVGKDEVRRGRHMQWIRVDRYFTGEDVDEPDITFQPVACVHCERAPCELVCPVNATAHSEEGLNLQVYNRCIGTRYCANNCPYKVRRFNWFDYHQRPLDQLRWGPLTEKGMAETLKMQKNPDVTVRMRGIMEKCTYCVQRIERGKIGAKVAAGQSNDYHLPDGSITPACAQACPAGAILFGDVKDPESRVSKAKARKDRNYRLLELLNTRPRTSHHTNVRNLNPAMGGEA